MTQHYGVYMLHKVITWYTHWSNNEVHLKLLSLYGLLDPAEGYENRRKATPLRKYATAGITLGLRLIVLSRLPQQHLITWYSHWSVTEHQLQ